MNNQWKSFLPSKESIPLAMAKRSFTWVEKATNQLPLALSFLADAFESSLSVLSGLSLV